MTTLIADSWELPSYLAGDLIPMDKFRDRERSAISDADWPEGEGADVVAHPKWRIRRGPTPPAPAPVESVSSDWENRLGEIEPYDPEKHGGEPADLVSADSQQALEREGFEAHDPGTWHRRVTHKNGDPTGMHHIITYEPGHRRPSTNERASWMLTTDPDTVGVAFPSLSHAISAANADRDQIRHMAKLGNFMRALNGLLTKTAVEKTPAQLAAEKWLNENSEDFETWHPSGGDYTYRDYGDAAGQSFHGGEPESHTLPGSAYDPDSSGMSDEGWERFHNEREQRGRSPEDHEQTFHNPPSFFGHGHEENDEAEEDPEATSLEAHGFEWQSSDPDEEAFHNPAIDGPDHGEYVRHQYDLEGNHIATHALRKDHNGRWNLETDTVRPEPGRQGGLPVTFPYSIHGQGPDGLGWALHKYKANSAETMLPRYGYEAEYGPANIRRWVKNDPSPEGGDYQHEITFPDETGFLGQTEHPHLRGQFAPNGNKAHSSDDLADVVREQHRMGQGAHPGGHRDYRLGKSELLGDPSVARLGQPSTISDNFFGDGRVGRASWRISHPHAPHGVNAEATYNWDKGGYDFKYTHDGTRLAPTHNYVPEGAPVHVPGRQISLF